MATRCPKLHQLEQADQDRRDGSRREAATRVGQAKSQSQQDEGEGMFAVLTEVGMGPEARELRM